MTTATSTGAFEDAINVQRSEYLNQGFADYDLRAIGRSNVLLAIALGCSKLEPELLAEANRAAEHTDDEQMDHACAWALHMNRWTAADLAGRVIELAIADEELEADTTGEEAR